MTEAEWLACADPRPMATYLRDRGSDRKFRHLVCAACRRVWVGATDGRFRRMIVVGERWADGRGGRHEREAARSAGGGASVELIRQGVAGLRSDVEVARRRVSAAAHVAVADEVAPHAPEALFEAACGEAVLRIASGAVGRPTDGRYTEFLSSYLVPYSRLVRCVFGNPFRPVAVEPHWLTPTVLALGEAIYSDRGFDRLPILADALEEAGCDSADMLAHCRGDGPHVRGCWVVDLVLRKE